MTSIPENPTVVYENINGDRALVAIERAVNELRCGRAVYCQDPVGDDPDQGGILIASAETASTSLLSRLEARAGNAELSLAITCQRAVSLGLEDAESFTGHDRTVMLRLHRPVTHETVALLAGAHAPGFLAGLKLGASTPLVDRSHIARLMNRKFSARNCDALSATTLNLVKHARLLPAALVLASAPPTADDGILEISAAQLQRLALPGAFDLEPVSDARVPLAGHEECRLVLFRDGRDASEHVAIIIGTPTAAAVPVRLHSACLTGDLLGSLRCDCGDQLRGAVAQIAAAGGGVLLYLAQEGRGIGLANKLRAYELQDAGLDTLEADQHLGFEPDERNYAAAASMLRHLGMTRIHLLTNNLEKIEALQKAGIEVVTGQRLLGAVNRHNAGYILAKRERAGHLVPAIRVEEFL